MRAQDDHCRRDNVYRKVQTRVYEVLEVSDHGDGLSKTIDIFLSGLIGLNVVHLVLETVPEIHNANVDIFKAFDTFSIYVFTIEYVLRIWSIGASSKYNYSMGDRLKFLRSPMALVDLLAILPAYLPFIGLDFKFLRSFRLLRLIKLTRYSTSIQLFYKVLINTKDKLIALAILCISACVLLSCLVYYAENSVQPEVFSSIPAAMWWAIVTMTTVGYGDMAPVTILGRLLTLPIFIGGIALFAGFTGIIGSAIMEEFDREDKE